MSTTLEAFGLDPNDPEVIAAQRDANDLFGLIGTLVGARNGNEMTQTDVAEAMGVGQSTVSNFERLGGNPTIGTVQRYARAVGARVRFVTSISSRHGWREIPLGVMTAEAPADEFDGSSADRLDRQLWRKVG